MSVAVLSKAPRKARNRARRVSAAKREQLILEYAPQIKYIAYRLILRLPPHVSVDDLISAGVIGLMDAIEKFDPSRNIQFKTYASFRIKGAMLDELRSQDWVPRSVRQKSAVLERIYAEIEQREGRPATDEEVAEAMNVGIEEFYDLLSRVRGVSLVPMDFGDEEDCPVYDRRVLESVTMDVEENPLGILKKKELKEVIVRAIEQLPESEQKVVSLYYYNELTMREIGRVLEITESRVSQIHTKAMLRMRGKLNKYLDAN